MLFLFLQKLGDISEKASKNGKKAKACHTFLKYFALCRNAIVLVMSMSFVAIMISINGESPVGTPGKLTIRIKTNNENTSRRLTVTNNANNCSY